MGCGTVLYVSVYIEVSVLVVVSVLVGVGMFMCLFNLMVVSDGFTLLFGVIG